MTSRQRWSLIAVSVATFMLLLDITVVNVALPDIQRSLDASFTDLQWVIDAYALTPEATRIDWPGVLTFSGALFALVRLDPGQRRRLGEPVDRRPAGRDRRSARGVRLRRAPPPRPSPAPSTTSC